MRIDRRLLMMGKKIVDFRPWGRFEQFAANEKCSVKLLYVKRGKRNSYQYHVNRSEFWHIVSGKVIVTLNGRSKRLEAGGEAVIPLRVKHRVFGVTDAVVLELIKGEFYEEDIVRVQDDYGRK